MLYVIFTLIAAVVGIIIAMHFFKLFIETSHRRFPQYSRRQWKKHVVKMVLCSVLPALGVFILGSIAKIPTIICIIFMVITGLVVLYRCPRYPQKKWSFRKR